MPRTLRSIMLALLVVVVVSLVGLATIDPLFSALGADEGTLPLAHHCKQPGYLGLGLLVIPMVGNGAIRTTGDMKTPSIARVAAGLVSG